MSGGFFASSEMAASRTPLRLVPACGACGLYKTCRSPKMAPTGAGRRRILIVGEAPGAEEDARNEQFVGKTGQRLRSTLRKLGLDPSRDCWFTNALVCRPPQNATPDDKKIGYCRPNLTKAVRELSPEVVIPLGSVAVKSLLVPLYKDDVGGVARWAGWKIPCQEINTWVCPTFHPSYVEREESTVLTRQWEDHLAAAVALKGRPFDEVPDYAAAVEVVLDANEAAERILALERKGGVVCFDYETTSRKPDLEQARIVSCAVSSYANRGPLTLGKEAFSFPWHGAAIRAMKKLLTSDSTKKVGANVKFEDRWTRAKLGVAVRNWVWDTVVDAHVLDNRPEITSVKFQAFVLLGLAPWDSHVRPYLKSKDQGGNAQNRIHEVSLPDLLEYGGIDALAELGIAEVQRKLIYG